MPQRCCTRHASDYSDLLSQGITRVQSTKVARLWAGMGSVVEIAVHSDHVDVVNVIAKRVTWEEASSCSLNIGDRRKRGLCIRDMKCSCWHLASAARHALV